MSVTWDLVGVQVPHFFFAFDSISWCTVGKSEIRRVGVNPVWRTDWVTSLPCDGVSENFRVQVFALKSMWLVFGLCLDYCHCSCTVWMVPVGQELSAPSCESTSPVNPHAFFLLMHSRNLSPRSHKQGYQQQVIQDAPGWSAFVSPSSFPLEYFMGARAFREFV